MWLNAQGDNLLEVLKVLDSQPRCDLDTMPCERQEAYVELDGTMSEAGEYGHLGQYKRQLTPRRFTYWARNVPAECLQAAPS